MATNYKNLYFKTEKRKKTFLLQKIEKLSAKPLKRHCKKKKTNKQFFFLIVKNKFIVVSCNFNLSKHNFVSLNTSQVKFLWIQSKVKIITFLPL